MASDKGKGPEVKETESLTRREMLRRLGGFSAVAAGVLADVMMPKLAAADQVTDILDFIPAIIRGGIVRTGDLLKIKSSAISPSSIYEPIIIRFDYPDSIKPDWQYLTKILFCGNGWAAVPVPFCFYCTIKNGKFIVEELFSTKMSVLMFTFRGTIMLKYASRTINYKASVPVSRAGAQVMDLADKVLRLLLDLQFFAQQHFPSDLYNTWKKVYPAASQAAIQLYNAAKATSEGREYVYPNLNGELLRARPQEMAVFDHALNALGTPHLISYPAAITMGNGPADPRSASPDSTASAVAWGFGNSFLDWLDNGLPESLKGGMTKVVTLLGTAVPAAATLGYLLEMGTVGTAVGIGAMGVVLPVAVTAASMVAVGCVLNNISDGYGQQWVPGLNWLSDLYSGLDLSSIPRRLIGALDGLGNNIAEVLSSGELASMGRTAASHAAAGVWEPWCGACTSCISCTAACTTCTSCTSTCTGCTGCTASCISCTNCTSCTSSCTYCTGGCTQCTSNGDTVR